MIEMMKLGLREFWRIPLLLIPTLASAAEDIGSHQPFFNKYCVACHGPKEPKGELRLDRITALNTETFQAIYERLAEGSMPPDDQPQPSSAERKTLVRHVLELAKTESAVTASGLRRLNKREYGNTVRDLLGLHEGIFDPSEYVYDDEIDEGFDTSAESLVISNELLMEYMEAADKSLRHALFTAETSRPNARTVNVSVPRMKGVGGSRYINNYKNHIVCRCGGKAMVYDGRPTRTITIPGRYRITVKAAAIDRDTYPVRFTPERGPVIMGFGVQQDAATSVSVKPQLLKTFELKDEVDQTFTFDTWIDKDHFPYFSFVNGSSKPITQVRAGIRQRKLDRSEIKKPYRGPGIRITAFQVEGPFIDEWPPASIRTTYGTNELPDLTNPADRQKVLLQFANRAFRRSVSQDEVAPYLAYMNKQFASSGFRQKSQQSNEPPSTTYIGNSGESHYRAWHEAIIKTFAAMMSSMDFLYIREEQGELDPFELANRLSYFFWSTMPDDELFRLAESGKLTDPSVLREQVSRMLSDPRSEQFSTSFAEQWLALDKLGTMPPDAKGEFRVYYKAGLESAMLEETHRYFRYVLDENRSIREFLDSDYSFVNQSLADLYGVPFDGSDKNDFVRVKFPPNAKRGGLLGHGSILTLSANGVETSPIERGVWVLAELLGTPPPPPPKAVPALTPDLNGAVTVRQMLEKHRSDPACMECHRRMDPLGFALEAYDPIGRYRTKYSKTQTVSTHGNYLGQDFTDVTELKQILSSEVRPFARNLIIRIAEYAKGRKLIAADYATVESLVETAADSGFKFQDIIKGVASSSLMTHR